MSTCAATLAPSLQPEIEDEELVLVEACRAGNSAAFEELVRRHERRIFRIAQYIVQNREDAEDVVQDSFLKAYQKLDQFRGQAKFSTWLVRITVNHALMKLRSRNAAAMTSIDQPLEIDGNEVKIEIADGRPNPERELNDAETRERLGKAIGELSPLFRTVFVLRDVQGFSIMDTAEMLDLTVPVVKTRLLRARLKLRQRLGVFLRRPLATRQQQRA